MTEAPPLPMVLHCPRCGMQHIDQATDEWSNPPHRSHACQAVGCGCIWRPADVATTGVERTITQGRADNWKPGDLTAGQQLGAVALAMFVDRQRRLNRRSL